MHCGHACSEHVPGNPSTGYAPPAGACEVKGCLCADFEPQNDARHFLDSVTD